MAKPAPSRFYGLLFAENADLNGDKSRSQDAKRVTLPLPDDLVSQLLDIEPEEIFRALEKSEAVTVMATCEKHGPFQRDRLRFGVWLAFRGYPSSYRDGWSSDAGCAGCRSYVKSLLAREPHTTQVRAFELVAPALCPRHGEVQVRVTLTEITCKDAAGAHGPHAFFDLPQQSYACDECDSDWASQMYFCDQLNLSVEQWNLPGVGDQIMKAICRAEQAGK